MPTFSFLSRAQIDDDRWNRCVAEDPFFRHYALTYYLDAVCIEWKALVAPDYSWVWPLPIKKFPIARVYQPLLAQQLGPYGVAMASEEWLEVWQWITQHFLRVSTKFNDRYQQLPVSTTPHTNVELDLNRPYEQIAAGYNRNIRSNLKKAATAGVSIQRSTKFDPWIIRTFQETKGKHIDVLDEAFFQHVEAVFSNFAERSEAELMTATLDGDKVAQLALLTSHDRLLLFFSASNQRARGVGAMHALLNDAFVSHCQKARVFDFEGSNNENLAFFYSSFGGSEKVYLQAQNDRLFWPLNKLLS